MAAKKTGKIGNTKVDGSFISDGFSNWKQGPVKFWKHDGSECHKEAVERLVTLLATTRDVGETLSAGHAKEKGKSYAAYGSSSARASRNVCMTTMRETSCSCYNTTVVCCEFNVNIIISHITR
ncbi:hypothetical protein DPMN_075229 [Dreissena polymorpha]|uniref:Uncharacterized protein n=1 Tax=Dreissena polymorpha TaxID=45954 RepID=A0A9D3YKP8_DREPO|nr:hypothetical protein DPMN_075229 [Dreissena polymorpha]